MPPVEKFQRWVDLLVALISHRWGLTFDDLAKKVPAYRASLAPDGANVESVKRTFERDKDELKAFGVPIDTVGDAGAPDTRYRVKSSDFYLPYLAVATPRGLEEPDHVDRYGYQSLQTLSFLPEELLAIADSIARVRQLGDPALSADAASAMRKLAFDLPLDGLASDATYILPPRAAADPDVLAQLGEALLHRKRVRIDYHAMESDARATRTVEPWGLFWANAHWYLAAQDTGKPGVRNYRVSRIAGVALENRRLASADYAVPADFALREHARTKQPWELGDGDSVDAIVAIRRDTGAVRAAAALGAPVAAPASAPVGAPTGAAAPGQVRYTVRRIDAFARWLLSFAGGMVPVAPPSVVDEYHRQLAATLAVYDSEREVSA